MRFGKVVRGLIVATLFAGLAVALPEQARAQDGAVMRVVAPSEEIDASQDEVAIEIVADNVKNLAGFQFVLTFDEDVLTYKRAENSVFLTSTGRDLGACGTTTVESGAIRYSCVTLRLEPEGAEGSGTLATVYFDPKDGGTTQLALSNTKFVTPAADDIEMSAQGAELKVKGGGGIPLWVVILIIIGAAAVVLAIGGGALAYVRRRPGAPSAAL